MILSVAAQEAAAQQPHPFIWGMTPEEATAIFTLALVIVGAVTAAILIFQSIYIRRTVNLARDEFLSAHPPKLVVRRVAFLHDPLRIQYIVLNAGDTDATILESNATIFVDASDSSNPPFPPYSVRRDVMGTFTLRRGEQKVLEAESPNLPNSWDSIKDNTATHRVIFVGWMTYRNPGGNQRYTAFGRLYDTRSGSFKTMDRETPEYDRYEYSS
jgi:hypothetical protein